MIRRGFWLVTGAALGVTGYRRASRLAPVLPPRARPGRSCCALRVRALRARSPAAACWPAPPGPGAGRPRAPRSPATCGRAWQSIWISQGAGPGRTLESQPGRTQPPARPGLAERWSLAVRGLAHRRSIPGAATGRISREGWPLMESAEIARRFLSFFEQRGHAVVPSASLIAEDPTLLLVNAGHGAVQAVLPGPAAAAVPARDQRAEVRADARTSTRSARPPGTARSSRCWATSRSATTSRKRPSRSPGSC